MNYSAPVVFVHGATAPSDGDFSSESDQRIPGQLHGDVTQVVPAGALDDESVFHMSEPYDAVERAVVESLSTGSALDDAPPAAATSRFDELADVVPHLLLLLLLLRPLRLLLPLLDRVAVAVQPGDVTAERPDE